MEPAFGHARVREAGFEGIAQGGGAAVVDLGFLQLWAEVSGDFGRRQAACGCRFGEVQMNTVKSVSGGGQFIEVDGTVTVAGAVIDVNRTARL